MNELADDTQEVDWGPWGRPLFDDDMAKGLSRVGVIDVGSNSVRLVVFDGAARSPAYFYNEKIMCALGAGLSETGHLSPTGRERALSAIRRFAALAEGMGIPPLTAVATAAVREASDREDFCADVLRETGIKIWVIDGEEEARLSAQGVLLGWPGSYGLVCDIGGSSMELADLQDGKVGRRVTSALGPLKLSEIKGGKKAMKAYIKDTMATLHEQMNHETAMRLFLVGGSWRAIARIDMERRGYPLTVLHEYRMTARRISATAALIEACRYDEDMHARIPGFGKQLFRFIEPLFKKASPERLRLARAACLLHDVSWRAHPDYRAEVTFDNATRANLGGLKHQERVFLGTALLTRYSNKKTGTRFDALFDMLTEAEHLDADILGKAMRLGAMLWLSADQAPGTLKWKPKARELTLVLSHAAKPLFGEVAEARLAALGAALSATVKVKFKD